MKKILSLLAIILIAGTLNAQNLSFGPTLGFGHGWLSVPDDAEDFNRDFHPTYNIGAKLVYSFVSDWGISADVKFSSEGGKFSNSDGGEQEQIFRLNYIRVPIQGIYFFEQLGDRVRPKVFLGPSFGFLVGGENKTKIDGETVQTQKAKDVAKTFDFGLNGGVGANFRIDGNKWLNADITYAHGLTGIFDEDVSSSENYKNRGIGINIGLLFPINQMKKK
ncbi:MAG: porin family protein [Chitinophagaceae bacterium]